MQRKGKIKGSKYQIHVSNKCYTILLLLLIFQVNLKGTINEIQVVRSYFNCRGLDKNPIEILSDFIELAQPLIIVSALVKLYVVE